MRCKCCGDFWKGRLCKKCSRLFEVLETEKSFAFLPQFDCSSISSDITVLDLFFNGTNLLNISELTNLRKLRISHCDNIEVVDLRCNKLLEVLDCSYSESLAALNLDGCNNIEVLDISFCPKLTSLIGEFNKLVYYNANNSGLSELPLLPSVKFVSINNCKISDIQVLQFSKRLQLLDIYETKLSHKFDFKMFGAFAEFSALFSSEVDIDTSCIPKSLKCLYLPKCNFGNRCIQNSLSGKFNDCFFGSKFEYPVQYGDWHDTYRKIFGPWPCPPNDFLPLFDPPQIYTPPINMDKELASKFIIGVLFGGAVGDMVGVFPEMYDSWQTNMYLDNSIDITWTAPRTTSITKLFHRGCFTDDTSLSIAFIRGICEQRGFFNPFLLAKHIKDWIENGFKEHLDPFGIGQGISTGNIARHPEYLNNPNAISRLVWESSGKYIAGNGALMRTAPVACYAFWDEEFVIQNSISFCLLTHYNPLCVYSCVLVSLLISRSIRYKIHLIDKFSIDQTIEDSFSHVRGIEADQITIIKNILQFSNLNDVFSYGKKQNSTILTMGIAVWAMRYAKDYAQTIEQIIRLGDDTDTNACVAGACICSKLGIDCIPKDLIKFMYYKWFIRREIESFLKLMGMKFNFEE